MASTVPLVTRPTPYEERILEFKGLNRKSYVEEGEMSDMKNLTSDRYPLLCPRQLRGSYTLPEGVKKPLSIMTKFERIAMIAEKENGSIAFYYDGVEQTSVASLKALTADTEMVAINTKICFFPQKTYLSLSRSSSSVTVAEVGHLDASVTATNAPVTISNTDARILLSFGLSFVKGDAVDIIGALRYKAKGASSYSNVNCNVSCDVRSVAGNVITVPRESFIELTGAGATEITFTGTVKREVPDIHHVIEWNNRLWGASDQDNTIYACKLGDPKNWKYYQGTSLDSYYAQQGTDENWTGSAAYSGHLIFFKQNSMTKIYGTSPSSFQVTNTVCYGVEQGSSKSVVVINDKVFYKSTIGIMAYEGGTPYSITDKLNMKFKNVVSGTEGIKYYASIQTEDDTYELMVLDIDKAVWHKEDEVRFRDCCTLDGRLYFISDTDYAAFEADKIYVINPAEATEKKYDRDWMAVFGPFSEYVENQKIYSKMSLRFIAQPRTRVNIYIKTDDGAWEQIRKFEYAGTGGEDVPIIPRRCDRFYIKVAGRGDCEIKSLTRRYRRGSGVK